MVSPYFSKKNLYAVQLVYAAPKVGIWGVRRPPKCGILQLRRPPKHDVI